MGIELNNDQIFATFKGEDWYKSGNEQLFQVSGAAGTGKTTFVKYLIERLGLNLDQVLFCAYMGKAVSQMARNGLPAKTIHSSIYYYEKVPARDKNGDRIYYPNGKVKMVGRFILKDEFPKKIKLIVVDEGSTVEKKIALDLMSFGIPIIVLGDLNQLPPPFGSSYFLEKPDVILRKIMRQNEGDPIIWLSQEVLNHRPLKPGVYKNSAVINRKDLSDYHMRNTDIVLTGTNWLRYKINLYYREGLKKYKNLDTPHIGEKVICRKNDWDRTIDDNIYLTNGTCGMITYVDRESYNGKSIRIDFRTDFSKTEMRNIKIDYKRLITQNGMANKDSNEPDDEDKYYDPSLDAFEFANAITVHSSQGSQWSKVLFIAEDFMSSDDFVKFMYTGITRAQKQVTVVLP